MDDIGSCFFAVMWVAGFRRCPPALRHAIGHEMSGFNQSISPLA